MHPFGAGWLPQFVRAGQGHGWDGHAFLLHSRPFQFWQRPPFLRDLPIPTPRASLGLPVTGLRPPATGWAGNNAGLADNAPQPSGHRD